MRRCWTVWLGSASQEKWPVLHGGLMSCWGQIAITKGTALLKSTLVKTKKAPVGLPTNLRTYLSRAPVCEEGKGYHFLKIENGKSEGKGLTGAI